jgi:SAM-dependent methyltransferase
MDEATLDYLIARFDVRSMLDVGCGPGGMVGAAKRRNLIALGVDGDPNAYIGAAVHDYTQGPWQTWPVDLIWSTEFVEHVEQQYEENYLTTFDGGRVLFLTAAPPGFPGWHHVNCQPPEYWIARLATHGWVLDEEATRWVRQNGGHVFTTRQGLVFTK